MIKDCHLEKKFYRRLRKNDEKAKLEHEPSRRLTASALGLPLQWQILKVIGVPPVPAEDYLLGKFERGKDVEKKCIEHLTGLKEVGQLVEYRDCIGVIDAVVDSSVVDGEDKWEFNAGVLPHEIKSISNAKYRRINQDKEADPSHILQGALYGLALGTKHFAIDYIATDDYRIFTWVYETTQYKEEVDKIIDTFNKTLKASIIPVFEPRFKWQADKRYQKYPEFAELNLEQIEEKLKVDFNPQYKILKGLK